MEKQTFNSMQSKPFMQARPSKPVSNIKPVQAKPVEIKSKPSVVLPNQPIVSEQTAPIVNTTVSKSKPVEHDPVLVNNVEVKPIVSEVKKQTVHAQEIKPAVSTAEINNSVSQKQAEHNRLEQEKKHNDAVRKQDQAQLNAAIKTAKHTFSASEDDITIGLLNDDAFGDLLPFIKNINVTDINWNGRQLWIDDLKKGRYNAHIDLAKPFVDQFATRVSNVVSESFNKYNPKLEAETEELRISILHDSVAHTGTSISIRKTPAVKRINFGQQIKNGDYCSVDMANFMSNAVKSNMNIIICGLPGDGKTELLKYLTSYIPPKDRVITVEDNLEIHYHNINPEKDCIELKVDDTFTYVDAIKACLRQLPRWIMLSEARSVEVKYLIEALSTGAHCMTTIHTDDVRKLPNRIKNMVGTESEADRIEQDVYSFLNMGILIKKRYDEKGNIFRYISQMGVFDEDNQSISLIYDEGKRTDAQIPPCIMRKFKIAGINDPFVYTKLAW